ncbi:MAG: hypothetical protein HN778_07740 [Prolixibacteraceae bacterium]|jgi:hypothetical protein|nr:hypothetical protein [Prolixibacteraceae bacterium]MBT6004487.1 hypothetical protein [Prolixibacteraceae bacterium]MBT6765986.1 hypothetical protein [Prolixibacteraceae bacterium]MBT6997297.1 hypothetical protein [Prolixibacteraceae bacterium]MBT7394709.1 hypothetical protein [Prolixibacteraceae bacterium]
MQTERQIEIIEANSLVESQNDIVHCISNNSINAARILVVKVARPITQVKLL